MFFKLSFPSLSEAERPTIFFDSHDVSKPDSVSSLSVLDDFEKCDSRPFVNSELLERVIAMLRASLNMSLFGVDIVVEKNTGHYAIIAFPGTLMIVKSSKKYFCLCIRANETR